MSGHIVKITLEDTHPPVWRRVVLPDHISFYDLHWIIQTAFGWEDEHLHEFTFPRSDLRIGDSEGDSWGDVLEESEIAVDDYLFSHNWIRYTYDFGDDWRHKIVYEKEEPDYSVRYATVKKAKGDNFPEDCGGVWSQGEEAMIPFDLAAVNDWLQTEELPVTETDPVIRDMAESWSDPKALGKMIQEALKYFQGTAAPKQSFPDAVSEKLDQWESIYEKWEKQPKGDPVLPEDNYEQMVLPGIELPEEPKGRGGKRYILEKGISASTEEELLEILNPKQVGDYCKYLRISAEGMDKKQRIAAISAFLREHPKYYLYVLCREDVEYLREILALPGSSVTPPPEDNTLNRALLLGLLDFSVEKESGQERAIFSMAADLKEIFEKLNEPLCEETYQMLERVSRNISCYVLAYGLIELDSLYERYTRDFGKDEKERINKEDFLRIVYWHCNMNRFLMTVYRDDGACYAASLQLDAEQIMRRQMWYAEGLDYYPYSAKELAAIRDEGFGAVNPFWNDLAFYAMGILGKKKEVSPLLEICYLAVIHGDTVDEVIAEVEEWGGMSTIAESLNLWMMCMNICLNTALPMLKGYSRISYGKKMHCNPYELDLFDEETLDDTVEADTPLFAMPAKVQQEVMEIGSIVDPLLRIKRLERLSREHSVKNCDIQFMIAFFCIEAGKFNKADGILRKLLDDWPEDESVRMLYDTLTENIQKTADVLEDEYGIREFFGSGEIPYRREVRKIGRNEPCPCGSGKKYKQCCGKNK